MKAQSGMPENQSRNYYEFMAALEKGLKPEEAVFESWTGNKLVPQGLVNVQI